MARWQKGQSGNPNGRPRGSRDRLTESIIRQLADDWQQHGHEALAQVRQDEPGAYCRLVASVIPKNFFMLMSIGLTYREERQSVGYRLQRFFRQPFG